MVVLVGAGFSSRGHAPVSPGRHGLQMATAGGLGGCALPRSVARIAAQYETEASLKPHVFICLPVAGAEAMRA